MFTVGSTWGSPIGVPARVPVAGSSVKWVCWSPFAVAGALAGAEYA
jgi:hypothetical protein